MILYKLLFRSRVVTISFYLFCICHLRLPAQTVNFDEKWSFYRGAYLGAEKPTLDVSKWRVVDLPHDWSIEDIPGSSSPFRPDAVGQTGTGFTVGGIGWYRKIFFLAEENKKKRVIIVFDGVYMNADIWINGRALGNHPNGFTGFWYDLTDWIKFGSKNTLAVEVKNEGANSRWYSGSGITRHVWLKIVDPVHIPEWGVKISTSGISSSSALVKVETIVNNPALYSVTLETRILDPRGTAVGKSSIAISPESACNSAQEIKIDRPHRWSPDSPALYKVLSEIMHDSVLMYREENKFGIRKITVDTINGFQINGYPMKLKGACFHNDNGPLGACAYDRAEERRAELLKASGFNAVRCSHNPPAPRFLDVCDSLGLLVIDEAFDVWNEPKLPFDYHLYFQNWWQRDLQNMMIRDGNHPSVIMWSIGNEIPNPDKRLTLATEEMLVGVVRQLDSSRPITSAVSVVTNQQDSFFSKLDVAGYNYALAQYEPDHIRQPKRIMLCTESYPLEAFPYWMGVLNHAYVIGDFVWTGMDYIGEASIGWRGFYPDKEYYPWNLAYCGDLDICGRKRPQSFYRDVLWNQNRLAIFVRSPKPSFPLNDKKESWSQWNWEDVTDDWNWNGYENKLMEVVIYSSYPLVELFINGHSLGKRFTDRESRFTATFQVPYTPGKLKAIGYRSVSGSSADSDFIKTSGRATQIRLKADRQTIQANGQDLSYINIELQDRNGIVNPKSDEKLRFFISGPGTIAGVGNANPVSVESYTRPERKAWKGRCLVIVKSAKAAGNIRLTVSAQGMKSVSMTIHSKSL